MNKIIFYLIILACFVTMIGVITALIRDIKKLKEEKKIAEEIKDADNDEEVHDIINDIISLNNARVQND